MDQYYDFLLTNPLFTGISRGELAEMLCCMQAQVLTRAENEPVFLEGDPAGFIGIVLEGAVQLVREDYFGNRSVLTCAKPGDIFGEAFACAGVETMPISGFALEDTKVLILKCGRMLTVCKNACRHHNELIANLLHIVARKNLELGSKIRFVSRKTTREKLMAYLRDQAKVQNSAEFTIPLDRQALADYLGVERSAMSAELGKLRNDGILETKGSWFRLRETAF